MYEINFENMTNPQLRGWLLDHGSEVEVFQHFGGEDNGSDGQDPPGWYTHNALGDGTADGPYPTEHDALIIAAGAAMGSLHQAECHEWCNADLLS